MAYELRPVSGPAELRAMHDIRRRALFTPERVPGVVYDENRPEDADPRHQRFVLWLDGVAIGVARLDRKDAGEGVVRLVAITPAEQRRGHGRQLMGLVDGEARQRGMKRLMLNAHPEAVEFYRRLGWQAEVWDPSELAHAMTDGIVQMVKAI